MNEYATLALIAAIKKIKAPNYFLYNFLIGQEKEERTAQFEIHTMDGKRLRAPFVGKREKGKLIEKESFEKTIYEPPMIKLYVIDSSEAMLTQQFGSTIYGNNAVIAKKQLSDELKHLKTMVARTKQWALSQLLTTGVLPVEDGKTGIKFGDFNTEAVARPDATFDMLGFFREKIIEIQKTCGTVPDTLIISPDVVGDIINNPSIVRAMLVGGSKLIDLAPEKLGDGTAYIGFIPELNLKIYSYMDWVSLDGINDEPLLEPGTILGVQRGSFKVHYGAFAFRPEANAPSKLFIGREAVRKIASQDSEDDELQLWSAPLIIPNDAQNWFHVKFV